MTTFHRTVSSYKHGAHTMPGEFYTSPAIFAEEIERIFARSWHCVGRASALANAGDYELRTVAGESLIVLRDRGGELHDFAGDVVADGRERRRLPTVGASPGDVAVRVGGGVSLESGEFGAALEIAGVDRAHHEKDEIAKAVAEHPRDVQRGVQAEAVVAVDEKDGGALARIRSGNRRGG